MWLIGDSSSALSRSLGAGPTRESQRRGGDEDRNLSRAFALGTARLGLGGSSLTVIFRLCTTGGALRRWPSAPNGADGTNFRAAVRLVCSQLGVGSGTPYLIFETLARILERPLRFATERVATKVRDAYVRQAVGLPARWPYVC